MTHDFPIRVTVVDAAKSIQSAFNITKRYRYTHTLTSESRVRKESTGMR
jgi:PII-like signaling protein